MCDFNYFTQAINQTKEKEKQNTVKFERIRKVGSFATIIFRENPPF